DTVVLDKTGTVTTGKLVLAEAPEDSKALHLAASMAATSSHPLARALASAAPFVPPASGVCEVAGRGLRLSTAAGEVRLGSRTFCGVPDDGQEVGPELWLVGPGERPQ